MNRRISIGLSITLILLTVAATFSITMMVARVVYQQQIRDLSRRTQQIDALNDIAQNISSNYYWYDESDAIGLIVGMVRGYVEGLGDKYSYYLDAREYADYSERMLGQKQGIGALTAYHPELKQLQITEVFASSPAEKSGLKKGDVITKIGDDAVTEKNRETLVEQLSGALLTSVRVSYTRGEDEEKTVSVMLGYKQQTVSSETLGDITTIRISAFYQNTVTDFQKAVDSAMKKGAKALIFDLRGTSDGMVAYAAQIIDYLVPLPTEGTKAIATLVRSDGSVLETYSSDAGNISLPMAVLVNEKTAGIAELFACDLRDFGKAVLVGDRTRGNGTVQKEFRLQEGGAILLTVAMLQPYKSPVFHETGLAPDIATALNTQKLQKLELDLLPKSEDEQWLTAQSLFLEG